MRSWHPAFVAVSGLLGEPVDVIEEALDGETDGVARMLDALRSPSRMTRARALATELTEVATAIDVLRLG
jgi:hypothetical protein